MTTIVGKISAQGGILIRQNEPPVWSSPTGLGSNHESETITSQNYTIIATDPDSDPLTYSLFSGTLPTGAIINSDGTITGSAVPVASTTQFNFVARVDDGLAHVDKAFSITVNKNIAPTWTGGTPADLGEIDEDTVISIQVDAVDADGLPMSLTYSDFGASFPVWLSISSSGELTGTAPSVEEDTEFMFTVEASDGQDTATRVFTLTIADAVPTFIVDILANTNSFNLTTTLTGLGWDGVTANIVTINVASGITVGSTSIGTSGMTISLPVGSIVALNNEGRVQGRGGNGGKGRGGGTNGQGGGTALTTNVATTIDNLSGDIWGGGGGGGGGSGSINFEPPGSGGGGGGGGAGTNGGSGGPGGNFSGGTAGQTGSPGTATSGGSGGAGGVNARAGGAGGGPGLGGNNGVSGASSGTSGGAAGKSIIGISNVTFINTGDVRGPQTG